MKTVAIMQPYFFPYIGYWQLLNAVDEFLVYDDVNYIKGGWVNRNNILLDSKKHLITVPLDKASPFVPINQTRMLKNEKHTTKLIKTLTQAYKNAPHFEEVMPIIQETLFYPSGIISEAIFYSIQLVAKRLGITTKLRLSSSLDKDESLKGQAKVIHILQMLHATTYINAIGGVELYDKKTFADNGITLHFLKTGEIRYPQLGNEFIPFLSMIDVLMFNNVDTIRQQLNQFKLI